MGRFKCSYYMIFIDIEEYLSLIKLAGFMLDV